MPVSKYENYIEKSTWLVTCYSFVVDLHLKIRFSEIHYKLSEWFLKHWFKMMSGI